MSMYITDEKPSALRGDRRRVLVVADDPDVTGLLGAAMELAGFRVSTAGTGADGMVRLAQHRFDLAVWDATLPGSAGSARVACSRRRTVPRCSS